jgi:hypothetical protein
MRWLERQARLEERVHDCIDEIADEFDLEVPYYPEVFWIGKGSPDYKFRERALKEIMSKFEYEEMKNIRESCYYPLVCSMALSSLSLLHVGEESSHFLHLTSTGTNPIPIREPYRNAFVEMIGFLGSKVVYPKRLLPQRKVGDILSLPKQIKEECIEFSPEFFLYQQGYGLGGRIWTEYNSCNISKQEIRALFNMMPKNEKEAEKKILELRERFWPIGDSKDWIFEDWKASKVEIVEFRWEDLK